MKLFLKSLILIAFSLMLVVNACNANDRKHVNLGHEVEDTTTQSLQRIMRDISRNYQQAIMKKPYISHANYLENAKCGGTYCMFTEGKGFLYSDGYDTMIETGNFVFLPEVLYKSDRTEQWFEYMKYTMALFPEIAFRSDKQMNSGAIFSAFRFFEINGPLIEYRDYTYEKVETLDKSIEGISFDSEHRVGVLYYDIDTKLPTKIEISKTPFYSITHQRWVNSSGFVLFDVFEDNLFVKELFFEYKRQEMDYQIAVRMESPLKQNLDQLYYRSFSLLSSIGMNPFIEEITNLNHFESNFETVNIEILRNDLEIEKSLENQFQDNSGKPFFYIINHDGTKRLGHVGERAYDFKREFVEKFKENTKQESFAPSLKLLNRWEEFGTVPIHIPLIATYSIKNISENNVSILSVNPGCIFQEYNIDNTVIKPGETAKLNVHLTPNFYGYIKEYIMIETDTSERFYSFVFEADVE